MKYELNFSLAINTNLSYKELVNAIKSQWQDIDYYIYDHIVIGYNHIRLLENEDYDKSLVNSEDGYLYYPYDIQVMPLEGKPTIEEQVAFAKEIKRRFELLGCKVEIVADFERLL